MGQENCDHDFMQDPSTPDVCSHLAACEDHRVAATQLSRDNDVDIDAGPGNTPLMWAAYKCPCGAGAVSKLLASGADAASQDTDKFLALHIAAGKGSFPVVELLLQLPGINVNAQDKHGSTALHEAAYNGRLPIVELLLQHRGTDVNRKDNYGCTALHEASDEGRLQVVELLLRRGRVDINAQDNDGWSALHIAACKGHLAMVKLLLQHRGINVNLKDNHGRSALWFAKEKRDMPIYYSLAGDPRLNDNEIINPFGSPPHQCHTCSEMEEKTTVTAMPVLSLLVALFVAAVLCPTCD
ncbi:ankyrin repeat domain-containing protein [Aspergillus luchuensis]|uniref:Uncharacterized protein n=1 Tax=Aspergillus kawachii TaxID=1069201 RepID=A0A7R7WC57_ASPKA|nr:uncharacterized protein AKAW2_50602S [Aspergillus luchuensis]KAI2811983.1 hypothetical protein CBS115989_10904 [Aspergillus niger]GAA93004.1 hypothetical protein AKAW_11116 [Aspergillus luchuensis IFO 4308]KAI2837680.1 hypothetical protein CBS11232_9843 [Aspergillus niger]KAI2869515.1 hypothetical protein CBS115988_9958 [Aspergillus niger]BCS00261.1 hypothetical protein AKAW2_50602S [Aspergillus luchuensis]